MGSVPVLQKLRDVDFVRVCGLEIGCLVQIVKETIPALQKLRDEGLVRAIGFSGLPLDIYSYILDR